MLLTLLAIAALASVLCFSFVLLVGAPFVPTLKPQISAALDLLALKPGETLIELGCGDGRVLIAAARRGAKGVGYELNPILVLISWFRTRSFHGRIKVVWGDYWQAEWPEAEAVFAFILPRYMGKLHKKVMRYPYLPIKIASFAFAIPKKNAARERGGVYLYEYK